MAVRVTTQPVIEPVSLVEAKLHCRIDGDDQDSLIESLIVAARRRIEAWEWRSHITQTRTLTMDGRSFRAAVRRYGGVFLPYGPIQSVTSFGHVYNGTSATFATDQYSVDVAGGWIGLSEASTGWPDVDDGIGAVTIVYVAGYGGVDDVPEDTKVAIKLLVGHLYNHREAVSDRRMDHVPMTVEAFLNPARDARCLEFV